MTLTIDLDNYLKLLNQMQIIPKIIESDTEYEKYLAAAEQLIAKKNNRSPEETILFRLLVKLIEDYEETQFFLEDWSDRTPVEILQHLLETTGTKQADLVGVVSSSKGLISAIVNGKRAISKEQAKKLGEYFKVSSSLFI